MAPRPVLVKIQRGGRITIPKAFCELLNIKVGDFVRIRIWRGAILITPKGK